MRTDHIDWRLLTDGFIDITAVKTAKEPQARFRRRHRPPQRKVVIDSAEKE